MNYRHAFHAGNFADVHKHVVLTAILEHLHKKPTPFFVLDTHAGRGRYDLRSDAARRGGESQSGIGRVRAANLKEPSIEHYLALADSMRDHYAGSPLIVAAMLREKDRAVFVEQQPEEVAALKRALAGYRRVSVLEQDGYTALKGLLPPKENRGLVLVDPPYEADSEFADVAAALQFAHKRWPNGIYAVWYPIKRGAAAQRMIDTLAASGIGKVLITTFNVRPADSPLGLNGSGMLVVNPPWQLDVQLKDILPQLHRVLKIDAAGGAQVDWLTS